MAAYEPLTEATRWSAMVDCDRRGSCCCCSCVPSSVQQKIEGLAADTVTVCIPTQKTIWREEKLLVIRGHIYVNDLG